MLKKINTNFQLRCWATCYHVYTFILKNGELMAYENYPQAIVTYFVKWIDNNKKSK